MKLNTIQQSLKAPKGQTNNFGKYKYRSCEDILEAVKPVLGDCSVTLCDAIECHLDRVYVKATAYLLDENHQVVASADGYAREPQTKKGMDESQITGAASSYARKYALNALFAIDDTKDADHTNVGGNAPKAAAQVVAKMSEAQKENILKLIDQAFLTTEQTDKSITWASSGRVKVLDGLNSAEAIKLINFIKQKVS